MRRPFLLLSLLTACGSGGGSGASQVATPTFTPAAGTYTSAQSVQIQCATVGATIYYTTDGSTPTATSTAYAGPVAVTATATLRAMATASGLSDSAVASAAFVISAGATPTEAPVFSPAGGSYPSGQSVSMSSATAGAVIYFTTDGSTPTTSSAVYSGAVSVSTTKTLQAIAVAPGHAASAVTAATYTITTGSGGGIDLDFTTCPFHPVWLAYQDGGPAAPWVAAAGSGNVFHVSFTGSRGGLAFAYNSSGISAVSVLYQARSAFAAGLYCGAASARYSVNGSLAGLGAGDLAEVSLGSGISTLAGNGPFSILNVAPGPQDLVAYRHNAAGTTPDLAIIRRGVNVANGGFLAAAVDFGTSEAFAPTSATITISGAVAGESLFHGMNYQVGTGCQDTVLYGTLPITGSTFTAHGIPAAQQAAGDYHGLTAFARTGTTSSRTVYRYTHALADATLALPAALPGPTITALAGGYKRLQADYTLPADYLGGTSTNFNYVDSIAKHAVAMSASPAYLGGAGVTLAMPDFSGLAGWDSAWAPAAASTGTWNASGVTGAPPFCIEGMLYAFAAQHGSY
jgi:hypothetical protein